jgi:hypothetical protein
MNGFERRFTRRRGGEIAEKRIWVRFSASSFSAPPRLRVKRLSNWACECGRREVVDFLIDRGVDLHAAENTNQTALHLAAHHGQLDIVRLLG